jgi:hypothetical protein
MNKTSTHIQVVDVTSILYGTEPIVVRPPLTMKVFRCTIYFQNIGAGKASRGFLTTVSDQNQFNTVVFASGTEINTLVPPDTDNTQAFLQQLILDRRGVGYMTEDFYVSSNSVDQCNFVFIFEGITQST